MWASKETITNHCSPDVVSEANCGKEAGEPKGHRPQSMHCSARQKLYEGAFIEVNWSRLNWILQIYRKLLLALAFEVLILHTMATIHIDKCESTQRGIESSGWTMQMRRQLFSWACDTQLDSCLPGVCLNSNANCAWGSSWWINCGQLSKVTSLERHNRISSIYD